MEGGREGGREGVREGRGKGVRGEGGKNVAEVVGLGARSLCLYVHFLRSRFPMCVCTYK